MGGSDAPSPGVVTEGRASLGGDPPDASARRAGGRYLPPNPSASRALETKMSWDELGKEENKYLLAKAAEGAGGGVFPPGGTLV